MLVFGSPEANRIAEQTKLLNRCTIETCPECDGRGKILEWDEVEERDRPVECWQCDGEKRTLKDSDGAYYSLRILKMSQSSSLLKELNNEHKNLRSIPISTEQAE